MAAGHAMLSYLDQYPEVYDELQQNTDRIVAGYRDNMKKLGLNYTINQQGSMFSLFFTEQEVYDFQSAATSDTELFGRYFREMLEQGVYLAPSQYEALFVSKAITDELADKIIEANYHALRKIHA
jgi:glutamate-1-semialdehyde 2,1-aminomutase